MFDDAENALCVLNIGNLVEQRGGQKDGVDFFWEPRVVDPFRRNDQRFKLVVSAWMAKERIDSAPALNDEGLALAAGLFGFDQRAQLLNKWIGGGGNFSHGNIRVG